MKKNKIMEYAEMVGELLIVIGAALWITRLQWIPVFFSIGALIFTIGRLSVQQNMKCNTISLKRLYRQRTFAVFALILSATLMFVKPGYYFGYNLYITNFSWFVLFAVFAIIEVYTAFRIPVELKKS